LEVQTDNFIEKLDNNEGLNEDDDKILNPILNEFSSAFEKENENNLVAGLKEVRERVIEEQEELTSTSEKKIGNLKKD
jgi:hypothetical protein